ncbi:Protein CBG03936 [Caenorhabditis briggsae]|uniref:Protein CBG03936 n=1 Tax=Caenorhabditis briggsae TaxID=6238 RepID=A8WVT1_CAEBR|nr:Protein CBG03936 [Caenorhabditis briggsae]CAP24744.2 Protein CBG03936 [Caenorhabditis briggsae]
MKVLKLLFLGSLCRLSASSSTPSNATSEDSVFLRIDTSLDAHSRLEAALNTLAELINPTKPNSELGKYFLLDDSIISELTNVDGTHADRIVKELTDLKYNLTAFNEKSKQFKMFEKLHQLINTTVIPGKSEKDEVEAIIGGWDKFDVLEFNLLKFHGSNLKNLEHSKDGAIAESRVRGAAARRFQQFWRRSRREYHGWTSTSYGDFRRFRNFDFQPEAAINGAKVIKTLEGAIVYEIRNKTTGEYKVDKGKFDKVMDERFNGPNCAFSNAHVFKFVDSHPKSSPDFTDFAHVCSKLAASVKTGTSKVEGLKTKLSSLKEGPYTKYVMEFSEYNVTQKFQSASILFKLFDRVIQASAGFDTFFKQGDLMNIEFQNLRYDDPNRRGWVEKMKILESVKSKFFDMKNQILKGREFYTPVSIENLMSLRWLVENLADISNPALQISQWSDFVLEIKNSSINLTAVDGFVASLNPIFDLNLLMQIIKHF